MKIGDKDLRFSPLSIIVFAVFGFGFVIAGFFGPPSIAADVRANIVWIVPVLILFLLIPVALNYLSQVEYAGLVPLYEEEAKPVRIRLIGENMIGSIVKIEGVVRSARLKFINRPQFVIADRTGEIPVKMFTSLPADVNISDTVEVYGRVIRRYIVTGDPVINGVLIRKTGNKIDHPVRNR